MIEEGDMQDGVFDSPRLHQSPVADRNPKEQRLCEPSDARNPKRTRLTEEELAARWRVPGPGQLTLDLDETT